MVKVWAGTGQWQRVASYQPPERVHPFNVAPGATKENSASIAIYRNAESLRAQLKGAALTKPTVKALEELGIAIGEAIAAQVEPAAPIALNYSVPRSVEKPRKKKPLSRAAQERIREAARVRWMKTKAGTQTKPEQKGTKEAKGETKPVKGETRGRESENRKIQKFREGAGIPLEGVRGGTFNQGARV